VPGFECCCKHGWGPVSADAYAELLPMLRQARLCASEVRWGLEVPRLAPPPPQLQLGASVCPMVDNLDCEWFGCERRHLDALDI
jgi:hypothetical protein